MFFSSLGVCVFIGDVSIKVLAELGSCCEMQMWRNINAFHLLMGSNALLKAVSYTGPWIISLDFIRIKKMVALLCYLMALPVCRSWAVFSSIAKDGCSL